MTPPDGKWGVASGEWRVASGGRKGRGGRFRNGLPRCYMCDGGLGTGVRKTIADDLPLACHSPLATCHSSFATRPLSYSIAFPPPNGYNFSVGGAVALDRVRCFAALALLPLMKWERAPISQWLRHMADE